MTPPHANLKGHAPLRAPAKAGLAAERQFVAPTFGAAVEVAAGVWWVRLPLDNHLAHVNVYVLDDGEGWTLVDTGSNSAACRWALKIAFSQPPLRSKPLLRIIATHYHPDHIGLAGELAGRGAALWTTRAAWLTSRLLQSDSGDQSCEALVRFALQAGLNRPSIESAVVATVGEFPRLVTPVPNIYHRITEGDSLLIGSRRWTITTSDGHAAEHAMLWSNDGLVISGDQVIQGVSARVAVHPTEPDANPVAHWLAGTQRIAVLGDDSSLVLPGHQLPFVGLANRCRQIISSYHAVLERLLNLLSQPLTTAACLEPIHRRPIAAREALSLVAEMTGYLNFLTHQGLVQRISGADDAFLWRRTARYRAAGPFSPVALPRTFGAAGNVAPDGLLHSAQSRTQ